MLGPLLFVLYINDLLNVTGDENEMYLFDDDAKLYRHTMINYDSELLNLSYNNIIKWSDTWLMKLNESKCKVLTVTRNKNNIKCYSYKKSDGDGTELQHELIIKNLGVLIDQALTFENYITERINGAYRMCGMINRSFYDLDKITFLTLYKSLVRSLIEYSTSVWAPHSRCLIT